MIMYMKKKVALILAAALSLVGASGCGNGVEKSDEKKTVITIADWPSEEAGESYKKMEQYKADFMAENTDIVIETSTYRYATDTFLPKAMTGQLPTLFQTYYTEIDKIVEARYAADITEMMKEFGMDEALYPNVRNVVEKDGKLYAIPVQLYIQGLICNIELFKQAGLVDEAGVPKFPQNYEELVETAKTIKQKTGKSGFAIPTTSNGGGWHFMNMAWSNGVEFMAYENEKWVAKFDTQVCYDTLQYIKDLKWKYDVLPSNTFMAITDLEAQFCTDQLAMYFRPADTSAALIDSYGISKDNIAQCRVPEGSDGRVAQMGGTVIMIANNATEDQKMACGKWLDFIGNTPKIEEGTEEKIEENMKIAAEKGYIIGINNMPIWNTAERQEITDRLAEKYCNINRKMFEDYEKYDTVIIKPEEPQKCQELYSLIDSCIQAVLTDENASPEQLIHQAAVDFQTNYLDRIGNEF